MSVKQVKVDNWGIYFLQRLKHFFNRTDYCDLTLQFQDNAQLKVHRLVLSACTEYFELLERTCEMYEDCLVMPDDLQADVVVPIVNFMYTGQLEFRMDLLERLHQTSQIMNMPVLTKLLDAHRSQNSATKPTVTYPTKRSYSKPTDASKTKQTVTPSVTNNSNKRAYTKAFGSSATVLKEKKNITAHKPDPIGNNGLPHGSTSPGPVGSIATSRKVLGEPRPTRYELPEELDTDGIFDSSFSSISYASKPLMVHPESTKHYPSKKSNLFDEASSSKNYVRGGTTVDIVECRKVNKRKNIFEDDIGDSTSQEAFQATHLNIKQESPMVSNQLFDQILDHQKRPKVTIESKDNKQVSNIDHAKIISEVLKKYPHLVKSNKNIKLKILNPAPSPPTKPKRARKTSSSYMEEKSTKIKNEIDYTFETDVIDSKEAAKLIALGAENVKGPWICLICGTPGRALHFTSYYKFRRHLVEVHHEKPVATICEYCGLRSLKRNYLLHHLYTKHGIEPPPSYHFPKCNLCNYVALTEGFLVKHKLTHTEGKNFRCNVCATSYSTSSQLLQHIQNTGHKYSADRKTNLQCVYCLKVFLRESNLYAHLKTHHKQEAKADLIIDDSDEEKPHEGNVITNHEPNNSSIVKFEPPNYDNDLEEMDAQYQIKPDGNIQLISKKRVSTPSKQKILNAGFGTRVTNAKPTKKADSVVKTPNIRQEFLNDPNVPPNVSHDEEIVMIDNNEYIMRDNQLIPRRKTNINESFILSQMSPSDADLSSTRLEFGTMDDSITDENVQDENIIKKTRDMNQPIQIVVSNEEEYKALMNSNHSIIFDDSDTNKTLTVLSAPHSATLSGSAIDLDSTQSNNMMIIPENYPLNVTEALPVDNSNIVVVYSHPVDDQSKPYQLITSQDIGAEFVQSSAVITQNYQTITTSTPVMTAHVIDTQDTEDWQNNIQENAGVQEEAMSSTIEMQEMSVIDQSNMNTDTETNNSLRNLPEVTLTEISASAQEATQENCGENTNNPNETLIENLNENVDQVAEITQNVTSTPMEVDVSPEAAVLTEKTSDDETLVVGVNDKHIEQSLEETSISVAEQAIEVMEEHTQDEEDQRAESDTINQDTDDNEIEHDNEQPDNPRMVVMNNEEVSLTKVSKEEIRNLASEWSEDEYDTESQEPKDDNEKLTKPDSIPEPSTDMPVEVEESVENIQQEMEKQLTEAAVAVVEHDDVDSSHEDNLASLHESEQSQMNVTVEVPQEKISSLLNDWEDNDSQEGNDSINENDDESMTAETSEIVATAENELKSEPKKDDKIKSLVSDWDDDEEESKN